MCVAFRLFLNASGKSWQPSVRIDALSGRVVIPVKSQQGALVTDLSPIFIFCED